MGNGYRAAVITSSDKGFTGEREDVGGRVLKELLEEAGYTIVSHRILPDEQDALAAEMVRLADGGLCDVIFTTGGTGLSPRDVTPEATLSVATRLAPGFAEAMRAGTLRVTDRAMLSRAVSVIRHRTLIINLPGSPKAIKENLEVILGPLGHGLEVLRGESGDCAR
jgi:molybdenum cofactor synthesis domain-containing protein